MKAFILSLILAISTTTVLAVHHYHGQSFKFNQPDGSQVTVLLYGDEYYMRAETAEGYTVIRDEVTGWICYATLSEDKTSLVSTGVHYLAEQAERIKKSSVPNIEKHLDITADARKAIAKARRLELEGINEVPESHSDHNDGRILKSSRTKKSGTTGNIKGLTILVDFSDAPATLPVEEFEDFMNGDNYTGYSNNGSVKEYYQEISGGLLTYENVVFGYYRAPKTFAQYDAMSSTAAKHEILDGALRWLDAKGFDFSTLTTENGVIKAINLMYTGTPSTWAQGMWYQASGYAGFTADGVTSGPFNTSTADGPLELSLVCHENGHMLCDWPDVYRFVTSTQAEKLNGVGAFDLMCVPQASPSGMGDLSPAPPNPYFIYTAGWADIVDITSFNGQITDTPNDNTFYQYKKSDSEYFLLKARRKNDPTGRNVAIPDEGLTIWHINENGDDQTSNRLVYLEHANNDDTDQTGACWHFGGNITFDATSTPNSNWNDGSPSGLRVWDIGAVVNPTSTVVAPFTYRIGSGTINDCHGDLGGTAAVDACGVCSGGNTGKTPNATCSDCNGDINGTAAVDACGVCSGGNTGMVANSTCKDCNGDINGIASFDDCGICTGGNTGKIANASCSDCNGDLGGTASIDDCGVCSGGNTGKIANASCKDCNGDLGGTALFDACGVCSGGNTGRIANATCSDCNGDINGTASIDACGVCSGGLTGKVPSSPKVWYADIDQDGLGDPSNFVQDCEQPDGYVNNADDHCLNDQSNTCNEPKDCNGDINGTATIDNCGICSGGNTGKIANACMDCHGDINGTAYLDDCEQCVAGNTSKTACNQEPDLILTVHQSNVIEGDLVNFSWSSTDPENDKLTYNVIFDNSVQPWTSDHTWTATAGTHTLAVTVNDGTNSVTKTVLIEVKKEGELISVISPKDGQIINNPSEITFDIDVSDPDNSSIVEVNYVITNPNLATV